MALKLRKRRSTFAYKVDKYFWQLLRGADMHVLGLLMDYKTTSKYLSIYNPNSDICMPANASVPWPVVLMYGGFCPKHIFEGKRFPTMHTISRKITEFGYRAHCKCKSQRYKEWWDVKSAYTVPGTFRSDIPEIRAFTASASSLLYNFFANALETAKQFRHSTRTWLPAFDAAQRHLKNQKTVVLQKDKDGGFALIESKHRLVKLQHAMPSWMYEPFFMEPPDLRKSLFSRLSRLAGKLGKVYQEWDETGDGLRFYVMRHAWTSNAQRLYSPILNTIKTHKSPPVLRVIHNGAGHPFAGAEHVISSLIRRRLKHLDHIHGSTKSMLEGLRNKVFTANMRMYKIDVKDFYLRGSPRSHTVGRFDFLHRVAAVALENLVIFVLENQYAMLEETGQHFRLKEGAGQGRIASGDLSDNTFYCLCERCFILKPVVQRKFGIQHYARYRDDAILIMDHTKFDDFFRLLSIRCSIIYELKLEERDRMSMPILDAFVFFQPGFETRGGVLQFRHYSKPTAYKRPLHGSSCHPTTLHYAWAANYIHSIGDRTSRCEHAMQHTKQFIQMYQASGGSKEVVERLQQVYPYILAKKKLQPQEEEVIVYLAVPFFFHIETSGLKQLLGKISRQWKEPLQAAMKTSAPVKIRIAYASAFPNLGQIAKLQW